MWMKASGSGWARFWLSNTLDFDQVAGLLQGLGIREPVVSGRQGRGNPLLEAVG